MKLAIQTSRLPGESLDEKFANARRYGFDGVEVSIGPTFDLAERLGDIRSAMASSGLPVSAICTHSIHDPLMPDPGEREQRFAGLANLLQLADELGAEGVVSVPVRRSVTFPEMANPERELPELAVNEFKRWSGMLPDGHSAVFLEPLNRYEATLLRRVEQAADLAERIGSPRVCSLADMFHMNIEESDMAKPIVAAASQLAYVHTADNNRLQPGAGCMDFTPTFRALKEIEYAGYVSIECTDLGGPLAAGGPDAMLPATVAFLRERWASA
ncbi:MAG TPA: sugar phosphate isomerase/epimerase [Thermomicrobiales bacterium]|jgi:sugar phosphate isomerase/epimerase|nr:sugar phosphate isomerase/epimerase [Thermomicrobiales bacterium]